MRINNVIEKPLITEKTMDLVSQGKYTFRVNLKASKGAIEQAIERLFGVDVLNVSTMIMPGKRKRVLKTNKFIKTKKWKKAVVQIKEGQDIALFNK